MKLYCSVTVLNRILPSLSINPATRYKNAVISLIKPSKTSDVYFVLVTQNNKAGYRYKIKGNIEKTFGQFKDDGKCTVRFREPPHDVCISAEKIPLKNLMICLKKMWKGEEVGGILREINVTPQSRTKSLKLEITKKEDYPVLKGLPNTLQSLLVNDCKLKKFDLRILRLKNLICLNLSKNELQTIPAELGSLRVKQLLLADNNLSCGENWMFLSGAIVKSLELLDISGNQIRCLPGSLSRFKSLRILKASRNLLTLIPFQICLLPELRTLDLSINRLKALPGTINRRCEKKIDALDVSGDDNFAEPPSLARDTFRNCFHASAKHHGPLSSLVQIAGDVVIRSRLAYDEESLPRALVGLLDNAGQCACGRNVVRGFGVVYGHADSKYLANTFISSRRLVPIMFTSCSKKYT